MITIPLADVPSQALDIALGGQSCHIEIRTSSTGLYLDLYKSDVLMVGGSLCVNGVRLLRAAYVPFVGDLMFIDTQGSDAPASPGLGSRFLLQYLEAADLVDAVI